MSSFSWIVIFHRFSSIIRSSWAKIAVTLSFYSIQSHLTFSKKAFDLLSFWNWNVIERKFKEIWKQKESLVKRCLVGLLLAHIPFSTNSGGIWMMGLSRFFVPFYRKKSVVFSLITLSKRRERLIFKHPDLSSEALIIV